MSSLLGSLLPGAGPSGGGAAAGASSGTSAGGAGRNKQQVRGLCMQAVGDIVPRLARVHKWNAHVLACSLPPHASTHACARACMQIEEDVLRWANDTLAGAAARLGAPPPSPLAGLVSLMEQQRATCVQRAELCPEPWPTWFPTGTAIHPGMWLDRSNSGPLPPAPAPHRLLGPEACTGLAAAAGARVGALTDANLHLCLPHTTRPFSGPKIPSLSPTQ